MGLQLPAALTEPLSWIGLDWPQADEELLFEAGQAWLAFGMSLQTIGGSANGAAAAAWQQNSGAAVEEFKKWWTREDGPQRRLIEDAIAAMVIGLALIVFAIVTLILKIAFIIQLIILAYQVAMAIAAAIPSAGASTAAVPGFIATTRIVCQRLIKQVVKKVDDVIKKILERAKNLLKKVEARAARRAARKLDRRIANDLRKVNPKFSPKSPDYSCNCTHCVQAYEMRRRGFDVQATNLPKKYHPSGGRPLGDIENAWGRSFTSGSQADIEKAFKNFGDGSRGVVAIRWNNGGGHVFNVENVGGKVRFLDGQVNVGDASTYFSRGSGTSFVRLDDLPTPSNLTEFVKPG